MEIDYASPLVLPLRRVLLDYDLSLLRTIADLWGVDLDAGEARAAADELAAKLLDAQAVAEMVAALSAEARATLDALLAGGEGLPVALLNRQYGEIRAMGPGRRERERPWLAPASPLETLWYRGLIGRAFAEALPAPQEFFFIPTDLRALLPEPAVERPAPPGQPAPEPEHPIRAGSAIVDDACTTLAYHQMAAHEPRIARRLVLADFLLQPDTQSFVERLLVKLELLIEHPTQPNPAVARPFLEVPRALQHQRLAEAWQADAGWSDLGQTPGLRFSRPHEEHGEPPNDALVARQAILGWLAQVPPAEWWSLDSFVEAVKRQAPDFQRPAGDYDSWLVRDAASGDYLRGFENWDRVEGAFIRYLIGGPLHWLGLVDLDAADSPSAFRLTMAGRAFLKGNAWPAGPPAEKLRIFPDGRLAVPRNTPTYERFTAARFTDWLSIEPPAERAMYHFRISAGSLERARAQGVAARHVLTYLNKAAGNPVPQPLVHALERWERDGTEATLSETAVLRVKSEAVLQHLRASPKTNRYLGQALGPLAVEVRRADLEKLQGAMAEFGLLVDFEKMY